MTVQLSPIAQFNKYWNERVGYAIVNNIPNSAVQAVYGLDYQRLKAGLTPYTNSEAVQAMQAAAGRQPLGSAQPSSSLNPLNIIGNAGKDLTGMLTGIVSLPATIVGDIEHPSRMYQPIEQGFQQFSQGHYANALGDLAKSPLGFIPGVQTIAGIAQHGLGYLAEHPLYAALDVLPTAAGALDKVGMLDSGLTRAFDKATTGRFSTESAAGADTFRAAQLMRQGNYSPEFEAQRAEKIANAGKHANKLDPLNAPLGKLFRLPYHNVLNALYQLSPNLYNQYTRILDAASTKMSKQGFGEMARAANRTVGQATQVAQDRINKFSKDIEENIDKKFTPENKAKVPTLLTSGIDITDEELKTHFGFNNEEVKAYHHIKDELIPGIQETKLAAGELSAHAGMLHSAVPERQAAIASTFESLSKALDEHISRISPEDPEAVAEESNVPTSAQKRIERLGHISQFLHNEVERPISTTLLDRNTGSTLNDIAHTTGENLYDHLHFMEGIKEKFSREIEQFISSRLGASVPYSQLPPAMKEAIMNSVREEIAKTISKESTATRAFVTQYERNGRLIDRLQSSLQDALQHNADLEAANAERLDIKQRIKNSRAEVIELKRDLRDESRIYLDSIRKASPELNSLPGERHPMPKPMADKLRPKTPTGRVSRSREAQEMKFETFSRSRVSPTLTARDRSIIVRRFRRMVDAHAEEIKKLQFQTHMTEITLKNFPKKERELLAKIESTKDKIESAKLNTQLSNLRRSHESDLARFNRNKARLEELNKTNPPSLKDVYQKYLSDKNKKLDAEYLAKTRPSRRLSRITEQTRRDYIAYMHQRITGLKPDAREVTQRLRQNEKDNFYRLDQSILRQRQMLLEHQAENYSAMLAKYHDAESRLQTHLHQLEEISQQIKGMPRHTYDKTLESMKKNLEDARNEKARLETSEDFARLQDLEELKHVNVTHDNMDIVGDTLPTRYHELGDSINAKIASSQNLTHMDAFVEHFLPQVPQMLRNLYDTSNTLPKSSRIRNMATAERHVATIQRALPNIYRNLEAFKSLFANPYDPTKTLADNLAPYTNNIMQLRKDVSDVNRSMNSLERMLSHDKLLKNVPENRAVRMSALQMRSQIVRMRAFLQSPFDRESIDTPFLNTVLQKKRNTGYLYDSVAKAYKSAFKGYQSLFKYEKELRGTYDPTFQARIQEIALGRIKADLLNSFAPTMASVTTDAMDASKLNEIYHEELFTPEITRETNPFERLMFPMTAAENDAYFAAHPMLADLHEQVRDLRHITQSNYDNPANENIRRFNDLAPSEQRDLYQLQFEKILQDWKTKYSPENPDGLTASLSDYVTHVIRSRNLHAIDNLIVGLHLQSADRYFEDVAKNWVEMSRNGFDPSYVPTFTITQSEKLNRGVRLSNKLQKASYQYTRANWSNTVNDISMGLNLYQYEHVRNLAVKEIYDHFVKSGIAVPYQTLRDRVTFAKEAIAKGIRTTIDPEMRDKLSVANAEDEFIHTHYVPFDPENSFVDNPGAMETSNHPNAYWISRDHAQLLQSLIRDQSLGVFDEANKIFKTTILTLSPRFFAHVLIGGMTMGIGATDLSLVKDFWKAFKETREATKAGKLPRYSDLIPRNSTGDVAGAGISLQQGHMAANAIVEAGMLRKFGKRLSEFPPIERFNRLVELTREYEEIVIHSQRMATMMWYERHGVQDVETQVALQNKVYSDLNAMSPVERTLIKRFIPFWAFESHIMRYIMRYPIDHPTRMTFLANYAHQHIQDSNSNLPQTLNYLFPVITTKGGTWMIDYRQWDPFRTAFNYFTMTGLIQGLNPIVQALMTSAGIDTTTGSASAFMPTTFNALYASQSTSRSNTWLNLLETVIPQSQILDHFAHWSYNNKQLSRYDPKYNSAQSIGNLINFPWIPQQINMMQYMAKGAVAKYRQAVTDVNNALATGNFSILDTYNSNVPYYGYMVSPQLIEQLYKQAQQLSTANPNTLGIAPKALITPPVVKRI
jgi:hypothetical protein